MVSKRKLRRLTYKIIIAISITIIIFNEFLIYILDEIFWNKVECFSKENCTRILLVADPQLLGEDFDTSFYSRLAIIDSDRYIKNTYNRAIHFSEPDIVIFLGDLLDEGSVASPEKFKYYVERFENVFQTSNTVKLVHIPGDNDIGGENGEYISNSNVRRFEIEFTAKDIFDYRERIRFFKINRMQLEFSNSDVKHNQNRLRIGLSHIPILLAGGPLLRSIMKEIDPHVFFTAHWHNSKIFQYPSTISYEFEDSRILEFNLDGLKKKHEYLEIMVPTSSYRMGKYKIGYGLAVIDNNNLKYAVLWTSSRFFFLGVYLIWLIVILLFFAVLRIEFKWVPAFKIKPYYRNL